MAIAVSIIISSQNRAADLRQTLASIAATIIPSHLPTELLMIDNASTDETRSVLAEAGFSNMQYVPLHDPKPGKSGALNRAIACSRGKVLLFTDDDVRVPPHWVAPMCQPILEGQLDGVIGGVSLAPHLERPWLKGFKRACLAVTDDYNDSATIMIGANMAIGRHVFEQVGGLDTELGPGALVAADDVLLSYQVKEAGFKIGTRLDTAIEHHPHESRLGRKSFLRRAEFEGRQDAYMFHHWLHGSMKMPGLRKYARTIKLAAWRLMHRGETRSVEGANDRELKMISAIGFCDQYLKERARPRLYAERGLKKLHEPMALEQIAAPAVAQAEAFAVR